MRIFMTGATGFIGSHLAHRLLAAGHELSIVARNPEKLRWLSQHPRVQRVTATLADTEAMRAAIAGCSACIHVALGWGESPLAMFQADTLPSVSLLELSLSAGVEKFIYTSSTAAVGGFLPRMDEQVRTSPTDYYGASKLATEAFTLAASARSGMKCNVIRPGYTFGNPVVPGATTQPDRRFHRIVEQALLQQPIVLKAGDGTQFISAGDLARLYEAVLNSERTGEVYFGLASPFVSWQAIAVEAVQIAASSSRVLLVGEPGEPSLFDLHKIQEHFGLEFESGGAIRAHLQYLIETARGNSGEGFGSGSEAAVAESTGENS